MSSTGVPKVNRKLQWPVEWRRTEAQQIKVDEARRARLIYAALPLRSK